MEHHGMSARSDDLKLGHTVHDPLGNTIAAEGFVRLVEVLPVILELVPADPAAVNVLLALDHKAVVRKTHQETSRCRL